jgi:hypothetical protein
VEYNTFSSSQSNHAISDVSSDLINPRMIKMAGVSPK